MAKPKQHIWTAALAWCFIFLTCNAPRKNPLDPQNPNAEWAILKGTVQSYAAPTLYLSSVQVMWQERVTTTNEFGYYIFEKIKPENGWLFFSKTGFVADSIYIVWNDLTVLQQNIALKPEPTLAGRVETQRVPPAPIVGVKVTWQPEKRYTFTDENGFYFFEHPSKVAGVLTFEKEGYRTFEVNVEWPTNEGVTKDVFLNANPLLQDFSLVSLVINYYEPRQPTHEMDARAILGDSEGDIDSVYIECPPLDIKAYLEYNILERAFERSFSVSDLGLKSLREVVGYDFDLKVVDRYGYTFELGQERVVRVINDVIEIDSPKNSESVKKEVTLKWLYFDPGFGFTYHVKIFTDDDFTPELVWEEKGIPADTDSVLANLTEPTDYLWEIWCVDEFDNRARSKPGSFRVEE